MWRHKWLKSYNSIYQTRKFLCLHALIWNHMIIWYLRVVLTHYTTRHSYLNNHSMKYHECSDMDAAPCIHTSTFLCKCCENWKLNSSDFQIQKFRMHAADERSRHFPEKEAKEEEAAAASHRFCKNSSFWRQHIINNVRGHERGLRFFCCKKNVKRQPEKEATQLRTKPAFVQIHFSWYWQFEAFANAEAVSEATASASLESFQVQKWKQPQGWSAVRAASGWVEPPGSACGKKAHKWRRPRNEDTNPHTHNCCYTYTKSTAQPQKSKGLLKENIEMFLDFCNKTDHCAWRLNSVNLKAKCIALKMGTKDGISIFIWLKSWEIYFFFLCVWLFSFTRAQNK